MRIFIALDIGDAIRERIRLFVNGVEGFAPEVRFVRPESLHITLKFIGEKPADAVDRIKHALSSVHSEPMQIIFRGYGFFPSAKAPRVFWVGIESGPTLASLARRVDETLQTLNIPKEEHAFSPHLTLARAGSATPRQRKDGLNRRFQRLQEKLASLPVPEFGTMTPHEFFLYQSEPSRGGSRYTKIARFALSHNS